MDIETECAKSICAAAARFAILANWRGNHLTALDEYADWIARDMKLVERLADDDRIELALAA